jgi:preprotein translocase subunit SecE
MNPRGFFKNPLIAMISMSIIDKTTNFFKEVRKELEKVTFLKREELIKHTIAVIAISILFSLFLGGVDYLFNSLVNKIIFR